MAPLATAFVRLRPQLSEAEVASAAGLAGDKAGAAMGARMSSSLSRTFKAAAGLGAATGLVEAGRKVLDFADQFEGARSRVEANTENIGASFEAVQKPLGDLDSRMSALGFTITDTENSFAQLVTATRDPAKSLRDVALAADIARGRHISLDEATQILMRVETGHVAMLGRLGIATRDASGHMFTQAQALDALGQAYGGNAAKFAETFAGKQAAARAEIQQSATEIGVALLPALADLANVVAHDVLPPIAATAQWFDRNRATIEPLVKAGLELVLMWKSYTLSVRAAEFVTGLFVPKAVAAAGALEAEAAAAKTASTASAGLLTSLRLLSGIGTIAIAVQFAHGITTHGNDQTKQGLAALAASGPDGVAQVRAVQQQSAAILARGGPNFGGVTKNLHDWATAALAAVGADKKLAESTNAVGSALVRTAGDIETSAQRALGLRSAQDGLRKAMHDAMQTAVDSGRAIVGNSDAALANRDAVRAEVAQIFAVIDAMKARGATDAAQANMLDILTSAVETNAIKTYGDKAAVDALLTSLGLIPGRALAAANAMAAINTAVASDKAISPSMVKAATASSAAATKAGAKIAASFNSGFSPIVAKGADKAAKTASTKFADMMKNDLQTVRDAITSTEQTLAGFAAFQTSGTDSLGAQGANTDFIGQKKQKAAQLEQFANLYGRLVKAGLNPDDLHEFVGLGPEAIPAMQTLLSAGRAGIRQENALDKRINRASATVAAHEAATQNYAQLHHDLQVLPTRQARALASEFRHMGLVINLREADRKNGLRIVTIS